MFIWQIKVAKTAKAKLCATTPSSVPQPKLCATTKSKLSKNSAPAEFLCFCTRLLVKYEFPDAKAKLCATTQALWHKPKLCATNPSSVPQTKLCATTKALCHKARHRGSRGALAHKNSLLTKRREPKPTNSACAEFANQNAGFIGGKTFQGENRQTIPRIRLRRILKFCAFAKKNAVSLTKTQFL